MLYSTEKSINSTTEFVKMVVVSPIIKEFLNFFFSGIQAVFLPKKLWVQRAKKIQHAALRQQSQQFAATRGLPPSGRVH